MERVYANIEKFTFNFICFVLSAAVTSINFMASTLWAHPTKHEAFLDRPSRNKTRLIMVVFFASASWAFCCKVRKRLHFIMVFRSSLFKFRFKIRDISSWTDRALKHTLRHWFQALTHLAFTIRPALFLTNESFC